MLNADNWVEYILRQVEEIEYEKYILTQIRPYASESIAVSLEEVIDLNYISRDEDNHYKTRYEYDSLDEPIRPKIDRWTNNICPVKIVDKFEVSDYEVNETYYKTESFASSKSHKTQKTQKTTRPATAMKKATSTYSRLKKEEENEDIDENELAHKPVPLDLGNQCPWIITFILIFPVAPPREIPIEEKILRERKEKQKLNQQREEEEK